MYIPAVTIFFIIPLIIAITAIITWLLVTNHDLTPKALIHELFGVDNE